MGGKKFLSKGIDSGGRAYDYRRCRRTTLRQVCWVTLVHTPDGGSLGACKAHYIFSYMYLLYVVIRNHRYITLYSMH